MCTEKELSEMIESLKWRKMLHGTYGFDPTFCICGFMMELNPLKSHNPGKADMEGLYCEMGFL